MASLKFGLLVLAFPSDGTRGETYVEQVRLALADAHGKFDSVWVADHFVPTLDFVPEEAVTLEAWTTLSHLAAAFPRFDFGNIVLCQSYRNPALLAKMAATLQTLTDGRFIMGIGAGWKEDEYRAYGYEFPRPAVRIQQLAETVQILRQMWTEPRTTFHGRHYQVENALCEPKPAKPIPIMVGGGGEQLTLRVVAEQADWWNVGSNLERYQHKLEVLRQHCADVGRDFDRIVKTWMGNIAIGRTEAAAQKVAAAHTAQSLRPVTGTPDQVAERLQEYVALGVEHMMLHFVDFHTREGINLFAEEVIPRFR